MQTYSNLPAIPAGGEKKTGWVEGWRIQKEGKKIAQSLIVFPQRIHAKDIHYRFKQCFPSPSTQVTLSSKVRWWHIGAPEVSDVTVNLLRSHLVLVSHCKLLFNQLSSSGQAWPVRNCSSVDEGCSGIAINRAPGSRPQSALNTGGLFDSTSTALTHIHLRYLITVNRMTFKPKRIWAHRQYKMRLRPSFLRLSELMELCEL